MDFVLRCNSLKCRAQLHDWAVVTTCSHIFCLTCSNALGLASASTSQRICPACQTALPNTDDAVRTQLNPTEDYKTSILSGLSPAIITECAGRALTFWSYQSSQEIIYQEFLAKSLTDRYGDLSVQLDKIINDANAQIESLTQKLQGMELEQDRLKTQYLQISTKLKNKSEKYDQTQRMYDKLKKQGFSAATQHAAFETADELLNAAQGSGQSISPGLYGSSQVQHGDSQDSLQSLPMAGMGSMGPPNHRPAPNFSAQGPRMRKSPDIVATPKHRQPLGASHPAPGSALRPGAQSNWQDQSVAGRRPLGHVSGNAQYRSQNTPAHSVSAALRQGTHQFSQSYDNLHGRFA